MRGLKPLSLKNLPKRVGMSISATARLLYFKPAYFFLAAVVSIIFYEIIFWFLNLGLLQYLLTSEFLTFGDKLSILTGSYSGIFTTPLSPLAITLFIVSALQGIAVSALVYSIKHERAVNKSIIKDLGGTGVAGVFAVLGLGCAACGTSLVTPILTFFFATSSLAIAEEVGLYSAWFALVVSIITVYLAGLKLSPRLKIPSK